MFQSVWLPESTARLGRWCAAALMVTLLATAGCRTFNFGGESYEPDPALEWGRQLRPVDQESEFSGVSNKARQIERNCGIQGRS
jgi:hypothetical protein